LNAQHGREKAKVGNSAVNVGLSEGKDAGGEIRFGRAAFGILGSHYSIGGRTSQYTCR
jgi:hypothetical protein